MKNWTLATALLLVGYAMGTAVGFAMFYVNLVAMWISIIVGMPLVFAYLCNVYLTRSTPSNVRSEMLRLIFFWIGVSFLFDCITYILIMPLALNVQPDWNFFMEQSPWIWISYLVLFVSGYVGMRLYDRQQAVAVIQ